MSSTMFVWLGSGRTRRNKVGAKGRLLDEAARARLPVPNGAIILDDFYRFACQEGLLVLADGRVEIPDLPYLSNTLYYGAHLPRFNRPVIIRPAFSKPDESAPSNPTEDAPQLVDPNDPAAFALALGRVWSAAAPLDDTWRRDTLVMEMLQSNTQIYGTAVTGDTEEMDVVAYHSYDTDHDTEATTDTHLELPRLSGWQRPNESLPPFARRLQQLLRGVRRTFDGGNWLIEWSDDGAICWLITVYRKEAS